MRPMRARCRLASAAALASASLALICGAANANPLTRVERAYANGGISPCRFSAKELNAALGEIPGDVAQYDADLIDAIHQALASKPSASCSGNSEIQSGITPQGTGARPAAVVPLRPVGAATDSGIPAALLILAVLIVLWALAAVVWVTVHYLGFEPRWARRAIRSLRESGHRFGRRWAGPSGRPGAGQ